MAVSLYIHDTMYVFPWYIVAAAGSLVLGVVVAVVLLITWALGGGRRKP
jgi:hypothetical protein